MTSSSNLGIDRPPHLTLAALDEIIATLDESEGCKQLNEQLLQTYKSVNFERVGEMYRTTRGRYRQIQMRVISLEYRTHQAYGGAVPSENYPPESYSRLCDLAGYWFRTLPLKSYREVDGKLVPITELSRSQLSALRTAAQYEKFCQLILLDEDLRVDFFKWALIDNCPVAPYVEFFGSCQTTIKKAFLHKRIGYFSGKPLKIDFRQKKDGYQYKRLTLPFETETGEIRERSIHGQHKMITFTNGYKATLWEVFCQFSQKQETPGNFEMLKGVISNWNYFFGRSTQNRTEFNDFDLASKDWYLHLPLFDTLTEAQMRSRYNVKGPIEPTQWVMAICSNRESETMDALGAHGFVSFLIPDGNGNYNLYPFTFLATQFTSGYPKGSFKDFISILFRLGKTEIGHWAYPDETNFYTRQQVAHAIVIEPEKGLEHMEVLRQDFLNARAGGEHFQISYKNCAGTVQMQAQKVHSRAVVPELFTADITENAPRGPAGKAFHWIRQRNRFAVVLLIYLFIGVFFACRGRWARVDRRSRWACVARTPIATTGQIYHAAKMPSRILSGQVTGSIWTGHTEKDNPD